MNTLKKVWLTYQGDEIYSLSLESASLVSHERLSIKETVYHINPTPERPKRHVVNIGMLGYDDLIILFHEIDQILRA